MIPGSASGLASTPWSRQPAAPSAAPTNSPSTMRGKRTFHSAPSPFGWEGSGPTSRWKWWARLPSTSSGGTDTFPVPADTMTSTTKATSITATTVRSRTRCGDPPSGTAADASSR